MCLFYPTLLFYFAQSGDRFSRSPLQEKYARVLQNVLCRERIYISSFADASQVTAWISMDRILYVQLKNKHSVSSKPMDRILRVLWRRLSPYGRENENHIDRFHGSTSIVSQEAPQLTTPSVFSNNDQSPTPHVTSTMLQRTCHRHPLRPYCRQLRSALHSALV